MSDNDEVQIIEPTNRSGNDDICQLCPFKFNGLPPAERQAHYNERHSDGARSTRGRANRAMIKPSRMSKVKQAFAPRNKEEEDIFWCPAQASDPPKNYTPDVLPILKDALKHSRRNNLTKRAVLCHERTPHIYREAFDADWGCGYRNFLMACAALMDQQTQTSYSAHLAEPILPGIHNLQRWIEDAWKQGYDTVGADQLEHELVDTRKRIGTGELYVAFTSRRIPCALVDFDIKKSSRGIDALTSWVVHYFSEELKPKGDLNTVLLSTSPVVATKKMPIIMQYEGHSLTIVGFEISKNDDVHLLVFDPSSRVKNEIQEAASAGSSSVEWKLSSTGSGLAKGKRRERSNSPVSKKRLRQEQDPDDDVVCIEASHGQETKSAGRSLIPQVVLEADSLIKTFRLTAKHKKHPCYQLLYFTMGEPLSDEEQSRRKVVYSELGC